MNNLISPQDLAKRTKGSSRTVSLRIKEKTWLGFEQLAKDNKTTANALISELADYYIESLHDGLNLSDEAVSISKFKTFLGKEVRKLCRWDIDDAVVDVNMVYAHTTIDGNKYNLSYFNRIKAIFKKISTYAHGSEYINYDFDFCTSIGEHKDILIYPTLKSQASYSAGAYDPAHGFTNVLFVPIEKSPDVISSFISINNYLDKNKVPISFDIDFMDIFVKILNKHDYRYEETDYEHKAPSIEYDKEARSSMLHEIGQAISEATGDNR